MANKILIDVPMPITTDRLLMRPPMAGDGQALFEAKFDTKLPNGDVVDTYTHSRTNMTGLPALDVEWGEAP